MFEPVVLGSLAVVLFLVAVFIGRLVISFFVEEIQTSSRMKRRKVFYNHFRTMPSSGKPTREQLAKVRFTLRGLAEEVHSNHQRWISACETHAAEEIINLYEKYYLLAEKQFERHLAVAVEFKFIKPCYCNYQQFLAPEIEELSKMQEISIQLVRNVN